VYNSSPIAPVAAGTAAFTGMTLYHGLELGVAVLVLVGMVFGLLNLLPRLAWEPITGTAGAKMRLTLNGRPIRRRG
jgi:hypothetical protein